MSITSTRGTVLIHPSLLRSGTDDLTDDCSQAPPSLLAAVVGLAFLPMDDSIVEFPYAMASRLVKSGRATKFPFLASSMRLRQNLTIVRDLASTLRADLRPERSSYTSLLQVHPKKCRRSMRISTEEFCSCLYRITLYRALVRASLTEETMRQTILEMVRLAREPILELLLLAKKLNLQQEVTTCAKQIGKNIN